VRRIPAVSVLLLLALPASPSAHRLDEYLQASRVSLARDRVTLELDVTPGANLASRVAALVDRDGDGRISPVEAEAYGRGAVRELRVEIDRRPVPLTLMRVEASSIEEMNEGMGGVRILAVGRLHEPLAGGQHQVYVRNDHHPDSSVYLVNALVPETRDVVLVAQTRDVHQREIHLDYEVARVWPARLGWLTVGVSGLAVLIVVRKPVYRRAGLRSSRTA
jgi:hypothetical protein